MMETRAKAAVLYQPSIVTCYTTMDLALYQIYSQISLFILLI